jgi:hypothetical protein
MPGDFGPMATIPGVCRIRPNLPRAAAAVARGLAWDKPDGVLTRKAGSARPTWCSCAGRTRSATVRGGTSKCPVAKRRGSRRPRGERTARAICGRSTPRDRARVRRAGDRRPRRSVPGRAPGRSTDRPGVDRHARCRGARARRRACLTFPCAGNPPARAGAVSCCACAARASRVVCALGVSPRRVCWRAGARLACSVPAPRVRRTRW